MPTNVKAIVADEPAAQTFFPTMLLFIAELCGGLPGMVDALGKACAEQFGETWAREDVDMMAGWLFENNSSLEDTVTMEAESFLIAALVDEAAKVARMEVPESIRLISIKSPQNISARMQ